MLAPCRQVRVVLSPAPLSISGHTLAVLRTMTAQLKGETYVRHEADSTHIVHLLWTALGNAACLQSASNAWQMMMRHDSTAMPYSCQWQSGADA